MEGGVVEADASAFKECFSLAWRNPYVLRLAFSAGIGGLLFGYDTGNSTQLYFNISLQMFFLHTFLIHAHQLLFWIRNFLYRIPK